MLPKATEQGIVGYLEEYGSTWLKVHHDVE